MSRRDPEHDYHSRSIYHITISKAPGIPDFSHIEGIFDASGQLCDAKALNTPIGNIIRNNLYKFSLQNQALKVWQYVIMPDHIHFILFVKDYLPEHIGRYISRFKIDIRNDIRKYLDINISGSIFEEDYYDRILHRYQSLDVIYRYINSNPYRLFIRRINPDYFRRVNSISICSQKWQAYGNTLLLDNPFKLNVVIHRSDSQEVRESKLRKALYYASNGGIIVSPFIAEAEKKIRDACVAAGGKIILLTNEAFPERYKPSGRMFELCESGRLLILAPPETILLNRRTCLLLNQIATAISAMHDPGATTT